MTFIRRVLPQI